MQSFRRVLTHKASECLGIKWLAGLSQAESASLGNVAALQIATQNLTFMEVRPTGSTLPRGGTSMGSDQRAHMRRGKLMLAITKVFTHEKMGAPRRTLQTF